MSEAKKNPSTTEATVEPSSKPAEAGETLKSLTKQVAKGGEIAFGGSVIGKVATFGLHILLGRVVGPGAYGLYARFRSRPPQPALPIALGHLMSEFGDSTIET